MPDPCRSVRLHIGRGWPLTPGTIPLPFPTRRRDAHHGQAPIHVLRHRLCRGSLCVQPAGTQKKGNQNERGPGQRTETHASHRASAIPPIYLVFIEFFGPADSEWITFRDHGIRSRSALGAGTRASFGAESALRSTR
jgi:hypothetical protein